MRTRINDSGGMPHCMNVIDNATPGISKSLRGTVSSFAEDISKLSMFVKQLTIFVSHLQYINTFTRNSERRGNDCWQRRSDDPPKSYLRVFMDAAQKAMTWKISRVLGRA